MQLDDLRDLYHSDWYPVSRAALFGWLAFFVIFLWHALTVRGDFRLIDHVNFIVHEAGHLLFSWLGYKAGVAGGTIFQFLVPALLAAWFFAQRQLPATAFCLFFFFENFLYSAPYIADARAMRLPLLAVGGGEAGHDWHIMLSWFGLLPYDLALASLARFLGWSGMFAVVAWFSLRGWQQEES